ncbi:MAG: hypothetical protein QGD96_00825 [Anaerolineae bacterium]|nr:hypothetical protein [Anaerolineae bacterium]
MRKQVLTILIILGLQACSAIEAYLEVPPTSTPTITTTPTRTPTSTPTFTPTITHTPRNTATRIVAAPTFTPLYFASVIPPTSPFTPTPLTPTGGFESIKVSEGKIFYGACKQNSTLISIEVEHPEDVRKVYLFFRLESGKRPGDTTPWTGTVTDNRGFGLFRYTLRANNIPERHNFIKAWVNYQLVAENAEQEIIGRTQIYTRSIVLEPCK